jgi:predicted dehydrogenase
MADTHKLRFGLVGYGSWAERVHIPSMALAGSAELVAICGPDAERAQRMADRWHVAYGTNDMQRLMRDPGIDAILIAAPNDAHAAATIAAAHAGKHILCEKPLGRTLDEARVMTSQVEKAGVRHMVAFTWRQVPAAQLAQRMVGEPITCVCARLSSFGPKPEIAGQQPVFDDGHLLLEFAGGAHGSVRISRVTASAYRPPFPDMHQGVELYGDIGALIYDLHQHSCLQVRHVKQTASLIETPDPLPNSDDEWVVTHELGRRQIERFAQAVRSGRSLAPGFGDGLRAQAVMQAAESSHESNCWVDVALTA